MDNARLLVVDDAPELGLIVRSLGKRCGWRVDHRLDAPAGWDFLQDNQPDLVLVDVRLPGMSGPELCRRLRADGRFAQLRLALFTHAGMPDDVAEGLEAGAPYLVSKELICRVEAWQARVTEILSAPPGRGLVRPLLSSTGPQHPRRAGRPSAALRHPSLRGLAPPILRALVRRACLQGFGPPALGYEPAACWLLDDGPPPEMEPAAVELLCACLAEQLWCLLGDAASRAVRADLLAIAST